MGRESCMGSTRATTRETSWGWKKAGGVTARESERNLASSSASSRVAAAREDMGERKFDQKVKNLPNGVAVDLDQKGKKKFDLKVAVDSPSGAAAAAAATAATDAVQDSDQKGKKKFDQKVKNSPNRLAQQASDQKEKKKFDQKGRKPSGAAAAAVGQNFDQEDRKFTCNTAMAAGVGQNFDQKGEKKFNK
jgi:hypothetical protein